VSITPTDPTVATPIAVGSSSSRAACRAKVADWDRRSSGPPTTLSHALGVQQHRERQQLGDVVTGGDRGMQVPDQPW
jgi:hypothetical protein